MHVQCAPCCVAWFPLGPLGLIPPDIAWMHVGFQAQRRRTQMWLCCRHSTSGSRKLLAEEGALGTWQQRLLLYPAERFPFRPADSTQTPRCWRPFHDAGPAGGKGRRGGRTENRRRQELGRMSDPPWVKCFSKVILGLRIPLLLSSRTPKVNTQWKVFVVILRVWTGVRCIGLRRRLQSVSCQETCELWF